MIADIEACNSHSNSCYDFANLFWAFSVVFQKPRPNFHFFEPQPRLVHHRDRVHGWYVKQALPSLVLKTKKSILNTQQWIAQKSILFKKLRLLHNSVSITFHSNLAWYKNTLFNGIEFFYFLCCFSGVGPYLFLEGRDVFPNS